VFRRVVFWLKCLCDLYLYGQVYVPLGVCPICGQPVLAGESVSGKVHARCLPGFLKRQQRSK